MSSNKLTYLFTFLTFSIRVMTAADMTV